MGPEKNLIQNFFVAKKDLDNEKALRYFCWSPTHFVPQNFVFGSVQKNFGYEKIIIPKKFSFRNKSGKYFLIEQINRFLYFKNKNARMRAGEAE